MGWLSFLDPQETFTHSTGRFVSMVHIYNVQTATIAAEVGRLFKDVAALPTWPRGTDNTREKGELGGGGTLSNASLVLNRKWHSSSSAFPPPPCHSLLLFGLVFFLRVC